MVLAKVKKRFSSQFIRNMGWLGIAQIFVRISRLATTIFLARLFTSYDYGLVAIIYTVNAFAQVFTESTGISASIVTAKDRDLEQITRTTYWVSWMVCLSTSIIQCALAFPIASFYNDSGVVLPICALSLVYLTFPLYKTHSGLLQREHRLKVIAIGRAIQALVLNFFTVLFALLGLGVWAVVLAMLIATPVWIVITYRSHSWRPPKKFSIEKWKQVLSLGGNVLGVSLMEQIRSQIDYLLIGRFFGVQILGMYFFAFSAALGISSQLINSMSMSLLPYLSDANFKTIKTRFFDSLKSMMPIITLFVFLQASLAKFYVPVVYGEQWISAIPLLVILCFSAVPLMICKACYQLLISVHKSTLALNWNLVFTLLFALIILAVVKFGIIWVAVTVLVCNILNSLFGFWFSKKILEEIS